MERAVQLPGGRVEAAKPGEGVFRPLLPLPAAQALDAPQLLQVALERLPGPAGPAWIVGDAGGGEEILAGQDQVVLLLLGPGPAEPDG